MKKMGERETVIITNVLKIVSSVLPQKDIISLLFVSRWIHPSLTSCLSLWLVLDFHEMSNAGDRLISALSLDKSCKLFYSRMKKYFFIMQYLNNYVKPRNRITRYKHVKQINLEFSRDVEDRHLNILNSKFASSLQNLESLNLNSCQKVSDKGIEAITKVCPNLKVFSIYWNVRVSDLGVKLLVNNCKDLLDLNLSGCKNVTDQSLQLIADHYPHLESLNLTRCVKITDEGLIHILLKCSSLQSLNLYALSSFSDKAYEKISYLSQPRFLDLCGAQNLSDQGLFCIAKCIDLASLNLTWCVRLTDMGVIAVAQNCHSLEFLSLFGIIGVTDKCLEALSLSCSNTISTLDVNGCINIKRRSRGELLALFPYLRCFKVHS